MENEIDLTKVLTALDMHTDLDRMECQGCPYEKEDCCSQALARDAMTVLQGLLRAAAKVKAEEAPKVHLEGTASAAEAEEYGGVVMVLRDGSELRYPNGCDWNVVNSGMIEILDEDGCMVGAGSFHSVQAVYIREEGRR